MSEKEFVDFATVRELLSDARERRGDLSYEQIMALQHAEWAASTNRGGTKTDAKVFTALYNALVENEKLSQYPEICSKLAELTPLTFKGVNVKGVRVIISSKRIAMDTSEVEELITIIRQHVL